MKIKDSIIWRVIEGEKSKQERLEAERILEKKRKEEDINQKLLLLTVEILDNVPVAMSPYMTPLPPESLDINMPEVYFDIPGLKLIKIRYDRTTKRVDRAHGWQVYNGSWMRYEKITEALYWAWKLSQSPDLD